MKAPKNIVTVRSRRFYKAGYEVVKEHHSDFDVTIMSAYTPDGVYIGDPAMARMLIVQRGIRPELASSDHRVCSIGYCAKDGKWYGWSHRAICGFGIGSRLKKGDCGYDPSLGAAKTIAEARMLAIRFAAAVS